MPRAPRIEGAPLAIAQPAPLATIERLGRDIGGAIQDTGAALTSGLAEREQLQRDRLLSEKSLELQRGLNDLQTEIDQMDPEVAEQTFGERRQAILDAVLNDPRVQEDAAVQNQLVQFDAVRGESARFAVAKRTADKFRDRDVAALDERTEEAIRAIALAETPEDAESELEALFAEGDALVARGSMSAKTRVDWGQAVDRRVDLNAMNRRVDENPRDVLRIAASPQAWQAANPGLREDDRLPYKRAAEAKIKAAQAEINERRASDLAIAIGRLERTGEDPDVLRARVESLADFLSGSQRAQYHLAIDAAEIKQADAFAGQLFIQNVREGRAFAIPGDPQHEAWADAAYKETMTPIMQEGDPLVVADAMAKFALDVGIVPDTMQGQLTGAIRNGDAGSKVMAADVLTRLREQNTMLLRDMPKEDIAAGLLLSSMMTSGLTPEQAVERQEKAFSANPQEREYRQRRYRAEQHEQDNAAWLEDAMGEVDVSELGNIGTAKRVAGAIGLWSPDVEMNDRMRGEFALLTEELFIQGGDIDVARGAARDALRTKWAVTEIGARRWERLPPEVVYGNTAGTAWIGEQLREEVGEALGGLPEDFDERVRLEPDATTLREKRPAYRVMLMTDGGPTPLDVEPWAPDWETSPAHRRMLDENAESMREAAETRAALAENDFLRSLYELEESGLRGLARGVLEEATTPGATPVPSYPTPPASRLRLATDRALEGPITSATDLSRRVVEEATTPGRAPRFGAPNVPRSRMRRVIDEALEEAALASPQIAADIVAPAADVAVAAGEAVAREAERQGVRGAAEDVRQLFAPRSDEDLVAQREEE